MNHITLEKISLKIYSFNVQQALKHQHLKISLACSLCVCEQWKDIGIAQQDVMCVVWLVSSFIHSNQKIVHSTQALLVRICKFCDWWIVCWIFNWFENSQKSANHKIFLKWGQTKKSKITTFFEYVHFSWQKYVSLAVSIFFYMFNSFWLLMEKKREVKK